MAILAGIFSMLGRFAGQLLNTTLGWATLLLFGKVPASRQNLLLVIVFGSLVWIVLVIGVLVPTVGTLILSGITLPAFVDLGWVRLAMLAGAILLPAIIGGLAAMVAEKGSRPTGFGFLAAVLRGFPFAAVLALVMVELAAVAIVRKLRSLVKRWEDTHVPVVVKPGMYNEALRQLSTTLTEAGLQHQVRSAGQLISGPPKLLDLVAGRSLGALVPDELMLLAGPNLETLVYPSDVAISGTHEIVARARAAVSSRLTHAPAYLTTSAEAQHFEDDLTKTATPADVEQLDKRLVRLSVPFDEWDVLYRKRLQLELEMLVGPDGTTKPDGEPSPAAASRSVSRPGPIDFAIAGVGLGLIAIDAVLVFSSIRGRRPAGSQRSLRRGSQL